MSAFIRVALLVLACTFPACVIAGPAEDSEAFLVRWKAAYDKNDNVALSALYAANATLHGTRGRNLTVGRDEIMKYFTPVVGSGNKMEFRDKTVQVLNESTVMIVGYNDFLNNRDGKLVPFEARFSILLMRQGQEWTIAHHHSSPRAAP
jgi:uncharacterized protein (TIGR02246 family)